MRKIMFNDRFGLTAAVLSGRKTMTRRPVTCPKRFRGEEHLMLAFDTPLGGGRYRDCVVCSTELRAERRELGPLSLPYSVGDVVAVAQRYRDTISPTDWADTLIYREMKGWTNKMFVLADLMPHHILITDRWFERLQDISDEDCLKEGVFLDDTAPSCYRPFYTFTNSAGKGAPVGWHTPRGAFANLIDLVSHAHVWQCNPWSAAYTFELMD